MSRINYFYFRKIIRKISDLNLFILIGVYLYIFLGALSYQSTYVAYPTLSRFIPASLSLNGNELFHLNDYTSLFDMNRFEDGHPRYTRPLSNLLMMLDHKLRSKTWKYFLPHPTLSLILILPLFLTPLMLFFVLRKWKINFGTSILIASFYLSSPGSLASLTQNFRPGKMMINFSLFFMWMLTHKMFKEGFSKFLYFFLLFLCLFWDETSFLIWISIIVLFYKNWINNKKLLMPLAGVLFLYIGFVVFIFPNLAEILNYGHKPLLSYHHFFDIITRIDSFSNYFPGIFQRVIGDIFGLDYPNRPQGLLGIVLFSISIFSFSISLGFLCFSFVKKKQLRTFLLIWVSILFFLISLHTILMLALNKKQMGIYYYGAYICPFMAVFFAQVISLFDFKPKFITFFFMILISSSIYKFHYYNLALKYGPYHQGFGPMQDLVNTGKFNPYTIDPPSNRILKIQTWEVWEATKKQIRPIPTNLYQGKYFEMSYVFMETNPQTRYDLRL